MTAVLSVALVRFGLLWLACFSAYLANPEHRERIGIRVPWMAGHAPNWIAVVMAAAVLLLDIRGLGGAAGTTMWLAECCVAASLVPVCAATIPWFSLIVPPVFLLLGAASAMWPGP